jgi:hypothetical protein
MEETFFLELSPFFPPSKVPFYEAEKLSKERQNKVSAQRDSKMGLRPEIRHSS